MESERECMMAVVVAVNPVRVSGHSFGESLSLNFTFVRRANDNKSNALLQMNDKLL